MNKRDDIERIKTLTDRFFNGSTSLDEESRLYAFFTSGDVPAELEEYRDLFCGFAAIDGFAHAGSAASGLPEAGVAAAAQQAGAISAGAKSRRVPLRRVAVAAAVAVAVVACIFAIDDIRYRNRLASLYGGSYMIVDGRHTDNLKEILPHIKSALQMAEKVESHADAEATIQAAEQDMLNNISDPEERKRIGRLLE